MKRSRNFACITLAPSLRSAVLLEFLWWCFTHTKIVEGDQRWVVLTYPQLEERTGLTATAVKRGMKELLDRGLVIRQRRMNHRVYTALSQKTNDALLRLTAGAPLQESPGAPALIYTTIDTKILYKELYAAQPSAAAASSLENSEEISGKNSDEVIEVTKTSDVLEAHKAKSAAMLDPQTLEDLIAESVSTGKNLEAVFRCAWKLGGAPMPIRSLTQKERGQLTQLANWVLFESGAEGVPTARILGHCVSRWAVFRKYLSTQTGFSLNKVSPLPEIGLLLYRKEHALRFVKAELAHAHAPKTGFKTSGDFLG